MVSVHSNQAARQELNRKVNHKLHFVDPEDLHTNSIESMWCQVKQHLKASRLYLASYFDEFIWRNNNTIQTEAIGVHFKPVDPVQVEIEKQQQLSWHLVFYS